MNKCIGPMTENLLNKVIKEVNKKKTKNKIMRDVIDPLLKDLFDRYYPYFITITSVLAVIIILLISILVLIVIQKFSNENNGTTV
jgi:uncharacterized membrane protein